LPVTVPTLLQAQADGTPVTALMPPASQAPMVTLISIAVLIAGPTLKTTLVVVVVEVPMAVQSVEEMIALKVTTPAMLHTMNAKVTKPANLVFLHAMEVIIPVTLQMQMKLLPTTPASLPQLAMKETRPALPAFLLQLAEEWPRDSDPLQWMLTPSLQE